MVHMILCHQPCDQGTWKEKEKSRTFIAPSNSYSFVKDQTILNSYFGFGKMYNQQFPTLQSFEHLDDLSTHNDITDQ